MMHSEKKSPSLGEGLLQFGRWDSSTAKAYRAGALREAK
jgi:hypothetical protein